MRSKSLALALAASFTLPSCATTNLYAWADTRLDSPVWEHIRYQVWVLLAVPALAVDALTHPFQIAGEMYPYGDAASPEPTDVRHRTGKRY